MAITVTIMVDITVAVLPRHTRLVLLETNRLAIPSIQTMDIMDNRAELNYKNHRMHINLSEVVLMSMRRLLARLHEREMVSFDRIL